ncbi:hypothetical protein GIB67_026828 [Kingdonia uniflora]|uniref:F-box domain-containing protein n=1 Tax=Kingdonia uniflora TaxID=39325 RepID=A0A7J7MHU2_9MAGN|nr:hypothetical protein GIB67_026828 [Kingdonia uniflora]
MKTQRILRDNGIHEEDRISKLPDSILHHILSFLLTRHAVSTSILSTRWRYVWTSVPILDFTDLLGYYTGDQQVIRRFMNFVERVLLFRDTTSIRKFSIGIHQVCDDTRINAWISAVIKRKVQEISLTYSLGPPFVFPHSIFNCDSLTSLELDMNYCSLNLPSSICLPNLKILILKCVAFEANNLSKLLSSCPILEELIIEDCIWRGNMNIFCISSPTLKRLTICTPFEDFEEAVIKIYAPNLMFFQTISFSPKDFVFGQFSSLIGADIGTSCDTEFLTEEEKCNTSIKLLQALFNIKVLKVSCYFLTTLEYAKDIANRLPTFHNLIRLDMNLDYSCLNNKDEMLALLQASPNLEHLFLSYRSDDDEEHDSDESFWESINVIDFWVLDAAHIPLFSQLKTVKCSGSGGFAEIRMLSFFWKYARVLKTMEIACSIAFSIEDDTELTKHFLMLPRLSKSAVINFSQP